VAEIAGLRVASAYVPNGQAVGSEKFVYKLQWLERLRGWLEAHAAGATPFFLCGDFNVAPEDRDVHDPLAWKDQVLCHPEERVRLGAVLGTGLEDLFRRHHPEPGVYSWWDYRMLSFPKNRGLRIDHIFGNPAAAARCRDVIIDRECRKGTQPSDHAPVIAMLD
jgi:exodeoxyribonuclease-3